MEERKDGPVGRRPKRPHAGRSARGGILPAVLALAWLAAGVAAAADDAARERNRAKVNSTYQERVKLYQGSNDVLVLPGVIADRRKKEVRVQAEATTLGENDPIEFLLIAEKSGHDYEALALSFARPSDVCRALCFVGMEAGRPVDSAKLQYWPKGERVIMTVSSEPDGSNAVRAETMLMNRRSGKSPPETGLVFVGSVWREVKDKPGQKEFAADAIPPNSIASIYNESTTVLDVPRRAPQGEVYNFQFMNRACRLPAGRLVEVAMKPEHPDGRKRVVDLTLHVGVSSEATNATLGSLRFDLLRGGGRLQEGAGLNDVLRTFTSLVDGGSDPFVAVEIGDGVPLQPLRELCHVLSTIETERGIRVEPPPPNQLYYKAFMPSEEYRDRAQRISQPWELRLSNTAGRVTGVLTQIEEIWHDEQLRPELKVHDFPVDGPPALARRMQERGPGMPVILVFAPSSLTYGEMMAFLRPVLSTHQTVHVFLDPTPARTSG